jgi:hypothetical protein
MYQRPDRQPDCNKRLKAAQPGPTDSRAASRVRHLVQFDHLISLVDDAGFDRGEIQKLVANQLH